MPFDIANQLKNANTEEELAQMCTKWLQEVESERLVIANLREGAVINMRKQGKSVRKIAASLGVSRWVVQSLLKPAPTPPQP
jgi:DNA-binding NarL/FixJ family response regulator